jgi:hypothetical protein
MSSNNNLTKNEYLEIQKCNKMIDIRMWSYGYSKSLFQSVAQKKYDHVVEEYEKCLRNIQYKNNNNT